MWMVCLFLAVLALLADLNGVTGAKLNPPDNRGTEFILMFMQNEVLNKSFPLELYITTQETADVNVNVTSPKWTNPKLDEKFTLKAGEVHKVIVDQTFRMSGNGISPKGIHVTADAEVVCYGANKESLSNDVYLGIPTDALGTEYYAMTYSPASIKSEIGVAATADNTDVKITLPRSNGDLNVTFGGHVYKKGDIIQVTLNKYNTMQLQSSGDLTGAHIRSDKPVAVFSGNIKTTVGKGQYSDHLVEQLTSVDRWGKQFVTAPIPERTVGDVFKIIARDNNTVVRIAGKADIQLSAGESKTFELPSGTYNFINASKPILVTQFVKGQQNRNEPADPSMMILPPYELFGSDYTFATPEYSHPEFGNQSEFRYENQFMVVTQESEKDGLLMDGKPIPSNLQWTKIPGTTLAGTFITVPHGSHTVRHVNPLSIFGGYLYGHAYHESYAFPTGMRLAVLHDQNCIPVLPSVPGDGIDNDCDNKIDEELCTPENQGKDDDGDGSSDEDCVKTMPVDGLWASWGSWSACSVSCGDGIQTRERNCSAPEPKFGGKLCSGNSNESQSCYSGSPCPIDIMPICKLNKTTVIANPINCAQYYDCNQLSTLFGQKHLIECHYPKLFSAITLRCEDFDSVNCSRRTMPVAPCDYAQNKCNGSDPACKPCATRLPNCVGSPDGANPFSQAVTFGPEYKMCFKNRTIDVKKCPVGYFNPQAKKCMPHNSGTLSFYCRQHPTALLGVATSCAKFYNCSKPGRTTQAKTDECRYPDLFSTTTGTCDNFTTVRCNARKEPQEPCEYDQFVCPATNSSCLPCLQRHANCKALGNGTKPFSGKQWSSEFASCLLNRTMHQGHCKSGFFHPVSMKCTDTVRSAEATDVCKANPGRLFSSTQSCAHYYNCTGHSTNITKANECRYPDLFSIITQGCEQFESVNCTNRKEPQAPCDYNQNLCNATDPRCITCPRRLPSCVGLHDGNHAFPTRLWKPDYIYCYKNRTMNITKCQDGYFHPTQKKCRKDVSKTDAVDYCASNPTDVLPMPTNCAQYYNCSETKTSLGNHTLECKYPDLFSIKHRKCQQFETVNCTTRNEPQAPCEYNQNNCSSSTTSCVACPIRLPSCRSLKDGSQPFPTRLWKPDFISCYKNRTLNITRCLDGYFHPKHLRCTKDVSRVDAVDYCSANPNDIVPTSDNCAQYFNCSQNKTVYRNHVMECKYPDLFSTATKRCENFTIVSCNKRIEPQAPCEYDQNRCNSSYPSCIPCTSRRHSCKGLPDGNNPIAGGKWTPSYILCYKNRTLANKHCQKGNFDPVSRACTSKIDQTNIDSICKANPNAVIAMDSNCAKYYNCSLNSSSVGHHLQECRYPDLFSTSTSRCEQFENVTCDNRTEPMAPCQYDQNLCSQTNPQCPKCPLRLPSCIGLSDGNHAFPTKLWKPDYITCFKNRTLNIGQCTNGYFHPNLNKCTEDVARVDAVDYCAANPSDIMPTPDNCAQYYNCTEKNSRIGRHAMECKYPDLFSRRNRTCQHFENVNCTKRMEPQAPCEYNQNICNSSNTSCVACPIRLPSCRGLHDGSHPFPTRLWKPEFIRCYKNRTLNITRCLDGYFHPKQLRCTKDVFRIDAVDYCSANPNDIVPTSDNCAQYYNCSQNLTVYQNHVMECKYPDLFSTATFRCENFTKVSCNNRMEPQAPCEYDQNQCNSSNPSCLPCTSRLHSCKSLPSGNNPIPGGQWTPSYMLCYRNRTIAYKHCPKGNFDPARRVCTAKIDQTNIDSICKNKPNAVIAMDSNCAKYYNCSSTNSIANHHVKECRYPDLFSTSTSQCEQFENVSCNNRTEPMAPCQYDQNLCIQTDPQCLKCPLRLPSCIGQSDGNHAFLNKLWKPDYITCYKNRTLNISQCTDGYFHPNLNKCTRDVARVDAVKYCAANPSDIVPTPDNCAQYYNCTEKNSHIGRHVVECKYPDLFSRQNGTCQHFESVHCAKRMEPQAPCEYNQNICNSSTTSCVACPIRFPSCRGLNDGSHPFPTRLWKPDFISCYKNRTLNITRCLDGYFHPKQLSCIKDVSRTDAVDYCSANPNDIVPTSDNCAQYYNCSQNQTVYHNHVIECKYPDLFSTATLGCENFTVVSCNKRMEPQAPCEYDQNQCNSSNPSCLPCTSRLHSCKGLPDGNNPTPGGLWTPSYILCYKNRTLAEKHCQKGNFDPVTRVCTSKIDRTNIDDMCRVKPHAVIPMDSSCAKYYNCSLKVSTLGHHATECNYPDLFSTVTSQCKQFENVSCQNRTEPMAPCQYDQSLCHKSDVSCVSCPLRLPSCIGLKDGLHPFTTRLWKPDYILCHHNRTINMDKCKDGYFHPLENLCKTYLKRTDAQQYCTANPANVLPTTDNCAQYFNCSVLRSSSSGFVHECKYPDLFSTLSYTCQDFTTVHCGNKTEPQAPCQYDQNLCQRNNSCKPCPERLPSCIGMGDGDQPVVARLWTDIHMICYRNRTLSVKHCPNGAVFDPNHRKCISKIPSGKIDQFCLSNPGAVKPHETNCAQFYNCTKRTSKYGQYLQECKYSDLFSAATSACQPFENVTCSSRHEPQPPCEYLQNLCNGSDPGCIQCSKRLPSCVGLPNGPNGVPGRLWKPVFIECYKNRTVNVSNCASRYFHPFTRTCTDSVERVDVQDYCTANPTTVVRTEDNCAQYINCSLSQLKFGKYIAECQYPDLFSDISLTCKAFNTTTCNLRREPQAPCEYDQNLCNKANTSCKPCPDRLPSCVGLKDGYQPISFLMWTDAYVNCYRNRTMKLLHCNNGYFHPRTKQCLTKVDPVDVPDYCLVHPHKIFANMDNCAKYLNCSAKHSQFQAECKYPDLYSENTHQCENFTSVNCGMRPEPQAPCQYKQNLCKPGSSNCVVCPERLPSCVGRGDGPNAFPGKAWLPAYVECFRNRTMGVTKCQKGYFHPILNRCTEAVRIPDVPHFCKSHPTAVIPKIDNCAQFFNCSETVNGIAPVMECTYPDLFSTVLDGCTRFTKVHCDTRAEPQAPCEYTQNLCSHHNSSCAPCPERLPSCISKSDGTHAFAGREWTENFIICYRNRTVGIDKCPIGALFDPNQDGCISKLNSSDIQSYCRYNKNAVIDHPTNCALYYNCSQPVTKYGSYLMECDYPELFSPEKYRCVPYTEAHCDVKYKPIAPCDYLQNQCKPKEPSCTSCNERHPSCIGIVNGPHPVPRHEWEDSFITCKDSRTVSVDRCKQGQYFHPAKLICTDRVENVDIPYYCPVHTSDVLQDETNCARYFNCSSMKSSLGDYLMECDYPDLFSADIKRCQAFENVSCHERLEPQAPCQYNQNLCTSKHGCQVCHERLPSCAGLTDGKHSLIRRLWMPDYIVCYKNRTIDITACSSGYFNPRTNKCETVVESVDVPEYCVAYPSDLIPSQNNCAEYFNCSNSATKLDFKQECKYPDLFSIDSQQCEEFVGVNCISRPEPIAPCEYKQNLCKVAASNCQPCTERLPSCKGMFDGVHVFPNQAWTNKFIECYRNRTLAVKQCQKQSVFHPTELKCIEKVHGDDLVDLCQSVPTRILPHPTNCAQYYNCSSPANNHRVECKYPSLYNSKTMRCDTFTNVDCEEKTIPQAPCEYEQFLCNPLDSKCEPCHDRLPSCIGFQDGMQVFPGRRWHQEYIDCYLNRTLSVHKCDHKYLFNPVTKVCVKTLEKKDVPDFCRSNPTAVMSDPADCSRYYNCSMISANGDNSFQCAYPDLFYEPDKKCAGFNLVTCGLRNEPQEPCMYETNICKRGNTMCIPCRERLPSCVSLPNGNNAIPGQLWSANYIVCLQNRTVDVKKCKVGFFDPNTRMCSNTFDPNGDISQTPGRGAHCFGVDHSGICFGENIVQLCKANPKKIFMHDTNCAQYFNCSKSDTNLEHYLIECPYPMLFDHGLQRCRSFSEVECGMRKEPQAPCDYFQNKCTAGNKSCQACPLRLPSCVGLPDGANSITLTPWSKYYIICSNNRTIKTDACRTGFFDPKRRLCTTEVYTVDVPEFCQANPKAVLHDTRSCGKYINCSAPVGHQFSECTYPQLFSEASKSCNNFTSVFCGKRPEPQAPCEYDQNLCRPANISCEPCIERLPSCRGSADGLNSVPGRLWSPIYVECFVNRTITVNNCVAGLFDPHRRKCTSLVDPDQVDEICTSNPTAVFADPTNCAHYFNCSLRTSVDKYHGECSYPELFSVEKERCSDFTVSCGRRYEPRAPCEYKQNLCKTSPCIPCSDRMPSCVGSADGLNDIKWHKWTDRYVNCFKNRTVSVERCDEGIFDPISRRCEIYISKGHITDFCKTHQTEVVPNGDNAAQYFNCSKSTSHIGPSYLHECPYPDLFDAKGLTCVNFTQVHVDKRPVPMAPCDYFENLCKASDGQGCLPCRQRLFSCVGLPDGDNAIEGKAWESYYIHCFRNRTLSTKQCIKGDFNPINRTCVPESRTDSMTDLCKQDPSQLILHEASCSLYYNCSVTENKFGPLLPIQLRECPYPELFSTDYKRCMDFQSVRCGDRNEVQAPCQYLQNQCNVTDSTCISCQDRLPSCIGLPDGDNAVPGKYWAENYLHCYKNRTLGVQKCDFGFFFHPYKRRCLEILEKVDVPEYCAVHSYDVIPSAENCAQYFNCSEHRQFRALVGRSVADQECHYPNLFSPISRRCEPFTKVSCGNRYEPVTPCEYVANRCPVDGNIGCVPCEERLPGCFGLADRYNAIPGKEYTAYYVDCYLNRTMTVKKCDEGFFDPDLRMCVKEINSGNIVSYCDRDRLAIMPHPTNCAWFYNCSVTGVTLQSVYPYDIMFVQECPYPKLFSIATMRCENYRRVTCGLHFEPQAPCEYYKNRCDPTEDGCIPCPNRIPSCKTLADGYQIINNLYDGLKYMVLCENNRTVSYEMCKSGQGGYCGEMTVQTMSTIKIAERTTTLMTEPGTTTVGLTTRPTNQLTPVTTHTPLLLPTTPQPGVMQGICDLNRGLIVPNPLHCGQYYNCTRGAGPYLFECPYPELFDVGMKLCRPFQAVHCGARPELVAPCEYQQNICSDGDVSCIPCIERLPSCLGLPNGNHPLPWKIWSPEYFTCYWNRTVHLGRCDKGTFDPLRRICISEISTDNVAAYCNSNPSGVLPNPANCAQYFECSDIYRIGANFEKECAYPLLFHPVLRTCSDYNMVRCESRYEPMTPCEYVANQCHRGGCVPCEQRFVSCLGKPDGQHVFPGKEFTSTYVRCHRNRTIAVEECGGGIFDPATRQCTIQFSTATVSNFCEANSGLVKAHPLNCAQYVDCAVTNYLTLDVIKECEYPKLFSPITLRCEDFESMQCGPRHEPKAPCEYLQNLCNGSDPSCEPCIERLPSCIGLPDGNNPVLNRTWLAHYIYCYKERTLDVRTCPDKSIFDPYTKKCVTDKVRPICLDTPNAILPNPEHCAQYYDCHAESTTLGHFMKECPYPQLFDEEHRQCSNYRDVECGNRYEPTSPCDYEQNRCQGPHCKPCVDRYPSCSGRPDGLNPYPGRELTGYYIVCDMGRYVETGICIVDKILDPTRRICTNPADPVKENGKIKTGRVPPPESISIRLKGRKKGWDLKCTGSLTYGCKTNCWSEIVDAFCTANPGASIASLTNCAQFYECGRNATEPSHYRQECIYPQLFSMVDHTCKHFSEIQCGQRFEPVAPCDYEQYQCHPTDENCSPCQQRLPSCIGLPDGKNAYPSTGISHEYIICEKGRTIQIDGRWSGYFDVLKGDCASFPYGLVPSIYGAGVCNDNLVSGLPDSAITASSVYGINDKSNNYGPDRARLNLKETKDAAGVTQAGAWVAEKGNLMQWIQVELKEPTLIRGLTTQGRNGCCQQWVSKYRVLHSMDCQSWTTVGGFNVTDAFFKGNSDEDTPVTNMFQCPVIAKCIRINPLDWKNNIGLRLDLIGCPLGNTQPTTTQPKPTTTPLVVTTKAAVTTGGAVTTSQQPVVTTQGGAVNVNTGAITTKATAKVTTPKPGALSGGPKNCIKSCQGKPNGDYQSCKGCNVFVTCNWYSMIPDRPCPRGLKWDDKQKKCDFKSSTCP